MKYHTAYYHSSRLHLALNIIVTLNFHHIQEDDVHLSFLADAEAGNAEAQMWLGRRYFWGYGGVQPNIALARRY
jgi:hypothetical protein